jgi:prephenate dehydrogenase
MRRFKHISVIGLGLLGGSVILAAQRAYKTIRITGYSHRGTTRSKARRLLPDVRIVDDPALCAEGADLVVVASPVCTFERIFEDIAPSLGDGCIVTDVGSTKVLAHRWAAAKLPKRAFYVGSHPVAGSEMRGLRFARDDLFQGAVCILTAPRRASAAGRLEAFWKRLGCRVTFMTAARHDRVLANVSHLPHVLAAALMNASDPGELAYCGTGFLDTSRIASGPPSVWADVLLTNAANILRGIAKTTTELSKFGDAIEAGDRRAIERLLGTASNRRNALR